MWDTLSGDTLKGHPVGWMGDRIVDHLSVGSGDIDGGWEVTVVPPVRGTPFQGASDLLR